MNQQMRKVTSRKQFAITKAFTNGFAQQVYELADGRMLFIDYHETMIEIVETTPINSVNEIDDKVKV